jgi:hypothetical protein
LVVDLDEETIGRHLVAMRTAVPAVRPTTTSPIHSGHRRARIRVVWAAGVTGLGLAFSGVAAAGALPNAAQHRVARVVAVVGIHIPDPTPKPANGPVDPSATTTKTKSSGNGGTNPGNGGGTNPGNGGTNPGNGGTNPGNGGGTNPGNGGTTPQPKGPPTTVDRGAQSHPVGNPPKSARAPQIPPGRASDGPATN